MGTSPSRRRGHTAATARVLTAGLSSAAAFGMVAGMAVSQPAGAPSPKVPVDGAGSEVAAPLAGTPTTVPPDVVVVIRRHWVAAPVTGAAVPVSIPTAGVSPTVAARPAPAVAMPAPAAIAARPAVPAIRPVTRSRGS